MNQDAPRPRHRAAMVHMMRPMQVQLPGPHIVRDTCRKHVADTYVDHILLTKWFPERERERERERCSKQTHTKAGRRGGSGSAKPTSDQVRAGILVPFI